MNYKTYILIAATLLFIVQSFAVFSSQDTNNNAPISTASEETNTTQMSLFADDENTSTLTKAADQEVWQHESSAAGMYLGKFTLIELCQEIRSLTGTATSNSSNSSPNQFYINNYVVHRAKHSHPQNKQWIDLDMPGYTDKTGAHETPFAAGNGSAIPGNSEWTFPMLNALPTARPIPADNVLALEAGPPASPYHQTMSDVIHIPEGVEASILIDSESPPNGCYILRLALNATFP